MTWMLRLNAVLGSLVVTVGFWLTWGGLPVGLAVALALGLAAFLTWQGTSVAAIWAWSTLLLGLESLAWPIVTMVEVKMSAAEPTEQQMGAILTSVIFGLFSAIFWMTFAYGIYKWVKREAAPEGDPPRCSGEDSSGSETTTERREQEAKVGKRFTSFPPGPRPLRI